MPDSESTEITADAAEMTHDLVRTHYIGARDLTSWPSRTGQATVRVARNVHDAWRSRLNERSSPYVVLLVTTLIGLLVTAVFTAASAAIYDNVTDRDGVAGLDQPVLDQMVAWRSPTANRVVTDFTNLGGPRLMPIFGLAAALLLARWWHSWTPILLIAIAAGGSLALTVVGKQVIDRARPPTNLAVPPYETSASFPSGHSLNGWVILLMAAYLVCCRAEHRRWRIAAVATALVLAVALGLSRVYLGHHWLTDVLVAWTLGSAWLIVVISGHRLALTVVRRRTPGAAHALPDSAT